MSWLFGLNKGGQPIDAPQVPVMGSDDTAAGGGGGGSGGDGAVGGHGGQGVGGGAEGYRSDPYSFDSTALERAAKAAKVQHTCKVAHSPAFTMML